MQRKDLRAIQYWAKGRTGKPTSPALTVFPHKIIYGGRVLAVRQKALCGTHVIFVEDVKKNEIDFGTNGSRRGINVMGRSFQKLHELDALFKNLETFKAFSGKADAHDIMRLANLYADIKKVDSGPFHFVPEEDSIRAAIASLPHRYEALAWHTGQTTSMVFDDTKLVSMGNRIGARLNFNHAVFFNFDDAVLFKLKHNDIKVCEI